MKFRIAFLLPSLLACLVNGQQDRTSLTGTVLDPSGSAIPKAKVRLISLATSYNRKTQTDDVGLFRFEQVPPGEYRLEVEATGFQSVRMEPVRLAVRTPATLQVTLKVGPLTETVTVSAEGGAVNTRDSTVGHTFSAQQIVQLPLEARNVTLLLGLQPGAVFIGENNLNQRNNRDQVDPDPRNGAVNGSRSDQANITLDGVDVNDQDSGLAFTSVLRISAEATQEFRVVTSVPTADQGRSGGPQVALVSRSGSNAFHGALFHVHRNTLTTANDFFNNRIGAPRPKLIRNTFGSALGGPVMPNRLFFFASYEGRRDAAAVSSVRTVPNVDFRNGIIRYRTQNGVLRALSASEFRSLDPAGLGTSPAMLDLLRRFPNPNDFSSGDGLNTAGFRFNAPITVNWNTALLRLDWNNARNQSVFWRANLQDDRSEDDPFFPGQPPRLTRLNHSRGLVLGHSWITGSSITNELRYGLTHFSGEELGATTDSAYLNIRGLGNVIPNTRSSGRSIPVHNVVNDFSWLSGKHQLALGLNWRWIRSRRYSFGNSYAWFNNFSNYFSDRGASLLPPDIAPAFTGVYLDAATALLGLFPQAQTYYNFDRSGNLLPVGSPVRRRFAYEEYEWYAQDSWRIRPNLTLTYGLRYSLYTPIYEQDGNQVAPTSSLTTWWNQRRENARLGRPSSAVPPLAFDLAGPVNNRPGFYRTDRNNFAPRLSLAYSPGMNDGWLTWLTGGPGRSALRAGAAVLYDRAGPIAANLYDAVGGYGLSTFVISATGSQNPATMARYLQPGQYPFSLLPPPPKFGFPFTPAGGGQPGSFTIGFAPDADLRTPYSLGYAVSWQRQLGRSLNLEVAFIGRESRNLLANFDVAHPLNLFDPDSRTSYFQAAQQLLRLGSRTPIQQVAPIPFWENLFPGLATTAEAMTRVLGAAFTRANPALPPDTRLSPTQVAYYLYNQASVPNYTAALESLDVRCLPGCSKLGRFAFYNDQFLSLVAWRSLVPASYKSFQVTLRRPLTQGVHFDLNYTYARAWDWTSGVERSDAFGGTAIVNSFIPEQMWAPSDYDLRHQLNANWVAELPFGRGRRYGASLPRPWDTLLGGWQLAGILRWTSGFPTSVLANNSRSTNPYLRGYMVPVGQAPRAENVRNAIGVGGPNIFSDPAKALASYGPPLPGETGARNHLRGDGLFNLDAGVGKSFLLPWGEQHRLQLRWEAFNITNTARFDARSRFANLTDQSAVNFGRYTTMLIPPRVMQFLLRYTF